MSEVLGVVSLILAVAGKEPTDARRLREIFLALASTAGNNYVYLHTCHTTESSHLARTLRNSKV